MPTYVYECYDCEYQADYICKVVDRPQSINCPVCQGQMRQILTPVIIEADNIIDTPWLKEFAQKHSRQGGKRDRFGDKPIETRTDYKKYLEKNNLRDPSRGENLTEV